MYRTLKEVRRKAAISNAAAITLATCAFLGFLLTLGFSENNAPAAFLCALGTFACAFLSAYADASRFHYEREERNILAGVTNKYNRKETNR